jgi:hypothetical protein
MRPGAAAAGGETQCGRCRRTPNGMSIGIHLGDLLVEGDDILGDCLGICARRLARKIGPAVSRFLRSRLRLVACAGSDRGFLTSGPLPQAKSRLPGTGAKVETAAVGQPQRLRTRSSPSGCRGSPGSAPRNPEAPQVRRAGVALPSAGVRARLKCHSVRKVEMTPGLEQRPPHRDPRRHRGKAAIN